MSCNFNTSQIAKEVVAEIDKALELNDEKYSLDFKRKWFKFRVGSVDLDRLAYTITCAIWLKLNR